MSDDASDLPNPVDPLVEEFLARRRAGEALSVTEFCAAHTEHEAALRELLPMLVALEDHKRDRASSGSGVRRAQVPQLQRLGDFKIVRELGRGGMGVVFEAVQESLGRKVALKVLPQSALLTGNQLERFVREAQIAAQLHHSNIVPVYGSGESDGYHWYAMQFIVGASLDRWQAEQRQAPPVGSGAWRTRARYVARLGQQAASALHWAHLQGTLHRDVKPGNLLLEQNDHLWVTDFGLAKALEQDGLTRSGDVLGTLQYLAPEQFAGQYDVRSEVYALGVTLYELLTLQPAFAGSSRSELMERIRTQRPESLRKLCPELPQDLVVVVEKAMAREPGDRYPDAGALAADLQAFVDDRPVAARRLSMRAHVWRWCRRNRGMAVLAASTLLAVVAAAVTGWVAYGIADVARAEASAALQREAQQSQRNDANVKLMLAGLSDVFDDLIGRDPTLLFEIDPETGEQTVITRQVVDPRSIRALEDMLRLYHDFAAQNADDQQLRFETARAHRRVGAIHVRLGKPANLASAANAYQQALQLLAAITDRDVTREKVAVLADL
ncbi:MAG: serine/threonine protein kinase, partial [Planctomycetes bacterium]|nr:serine/threonine protein kinase [Planctomycetota bacterium]